MPQRNSSSLASVIASVLALILLMGSLGAQRAEAAPPSGPLKDWPCPQPESDGFAAEALYGKPLPAALPPQGAWEAEPAVRSVVEFAAATENTAPLGAEKIAGLAQASGANKRAALLLALAGIVERANGLRALIVEGIGRQVVNSRLVAETVAANDRDLAALGNDGSDAAIKRRKDLEQARFWNRRSLGEFEDSAELLCHRLDHAEKKTRALAAAIREQIERP
jgi:hypothetical protein